MFVMPVSDAYQYHRPEPLWGYPPRATKGATFLSKVTPALFSLQNHCCQLYEASSEITGQAFPPPLEISVEFATEQSVLTLASCGPILVTSRTRSNVSLAERAKIAPLKGSSATLERMTRFVFREAQFADRNKRKRRTSSSNKLEIKMVVCYETGATVKWDQTTAEIFTVCYFMTEAVDNPL